ncbi:MAG: hypothetical protein PHO72_12605, partial [Sphaerochaeta sp.]|nr:hypothetical protein [Sphaerochaeta sp.]
MIIQSAPSPPVPSIIGEQEIGSYERRVDAYAQKYAYVDKYPADRMESGFFEVKTTAAFSTATTKTAPGPSGS